MAQAQMQRGSNVPQPHQARPQPRIHSNRHSSGSATYSHQGMPVGYPGANPHKSMTPTHSGHFGRGSAPGSRSNSRNSLHRQSQSLGASKASFVSQRSGKSSIQQAYQDSKVRSSILSPFFGRGRTPFLISVGLLVLGCLFVLAGGIIFGLRFHNNVMLSVDKGEIVGPVLIAFGILCFAGAIKFYYDAYKISNQERRKLKFSAANESMVTVSTVGSQKRSRGEALVSGTASMNAVTRTPQGSHSTLTQV